MRSRIAKGLMIGAAALALAIAGSTPAQASNPVLHFSYAEPNSPGSDTGSNTSLNGEWVRVKNSSSSTTYNLTGWTIRDAQSHVYKFGTFYLKPGYSVTLHTGKGTNSSGSRYWGRTWYVWNNTGDTATLKTSGGTTKDSCGWGSVSNGYIVTC